MECAKRGFILDKKLFWTLIGAIIIQIQMALNSLEV